MKRRNILGLATAAGFMLAVTLNAAPPVTTGLKLHLDASQLTGLSDGATVTTWTDMSGLGNNATASGSAATYQTGVLNGLPVVRFNGDGNASFNFAGISTIRTVFWVVKNTNPGNHFLLGHNSVYDFHSGDSTIWTTWTHDNIKNGTTKLNGTGVNGQSTALPSASYSLLSLVTTGNVQANQLSYDRTYGGRSWAGDMAEVLIYDVALTAEQEELVGAYLTTKYDLVTEYNPQAKILAFGPGAMIGPVVANVAAISWDVPFGSNPAALSPTFSLSSGAVCDKNSGSTQNFTSPVQYTVTSSDNLITNIYTVTVVVSVPPPVTGGLKLHLDASQLTGLTDGQTVTTWTDFSGSGNNATAGGTPSYKTGVLNGKSVIRFNNASSFTTANLSSQFPTAATVFIVTTISSDDAYTLVDSNGTADEWWRYNVTGRSYPGLFRGSRLESYCPMPNSGSHLFAVSSSSSAWEMKINGASQGVAGGAYNAGGVIAIGNGSSGGGLNGDIAEVIIYDRVLDAGELGTVGGYLADKYGLTTSYPPYAPPPAPTGLLATPLYEAIRLDWTAAARATGYNVYRGTASGTYAPTPIGTTTTATTYTDTTATSGGPYYYVVKGTNSPGEGAASNEASASPAAGAVDQTITFALGLAVTKTAADAPFADTASAYPSGSAVTYSVTPAAPTVATVDAATGVVTLMGSTGTVYVVASVEATPGYNAATNTQTLTVNQAIPVITWTPAPIVVGTYLSETQLNATSGGVPGTFVYTPPSGTLMDVVGLQDVSVQFTPTDTVKYSTPALKTVALLVVPVETTVIWNTGAGNWNTTAPNWNGQSSGLTTIFTQGNNAIFNSSAGGAITIASGMAPLTTTVSATSGTYTFSGGPIAGTGGTLTKSGNGSLTLNNDNTYTGGTVINAGQLTMNPLVNGALGTGTVTLNGGILRLERITIGNALTVNGGILFCSNGWGCNLNGPITLNSNLTVSGDGNSGTTTFNGSVSGVGGFSFTGPAVLGPLLKVANTYTGPTSVTACTLRCDNKDSLGSGALSLSTTGKLNLNYTGTKTVESLTLGGVAKKEPGTYGSVASGANYQDDTYFVGTGTVRIAPPKGTVISFF
jgi:autotransporter-associated beta strand protein